MPAVLWTNSHLADIAADLPAIRAAHIDVLFSYQMNQGPVTSRCPAPASDAQMLAYLDALHAAGLKAMLDVMPLGKFVVSGRVDKALTTGELADITAYIDKWKTHPAVWGWYADDEGNVDYPVATRQQLYDTIKASHPAGQVFETHWQIIPGAYSPNVHDVFAMDAGPETTNYCYYYDINPPYGCIDDNTGLVSYPDREWNALWAFKRKLVELKDTLEFAGEENYMLCMQAFGQGWAGMQHYFAMPPVGGISKMWAAAQEAGWDQYGVGWFLWHSDDATVMPWEDINGVGQGGDVLAPQRAELAAVAKNFASVPAVVAAPTLPTYCVNVAGEDVTDLVDLDTLHRSMSERGEASATIDIPVANENEVPSNLLARDAAVEIVVDGESEWLGHVVAVHKPQPQDLSYVLDCAGGWDTLHHCAPWCKGFVETRYDGIQEYSASVMTANGWGSLHADMELGTDGEVLFTLPASSVAPLASSRNAYLFVLEGLHPSACIKRVTFDWIVGGVNGNMVCVVNAINSPWDVTNPRPLLYCNTNGSGSVDWTPGDGILRRALWFWAQQNLTPSSAAADNFFQIRNLRVYVDRTTAPRVDEIVAAIDADVRPDAPTASIEAIGAPLTAFMCDPFMTPAEGIAVALTKAAVPPLCGIIQNQLVIKNRPTAPTDSTRLWTVSEQITPGLEWGVEVDEEQSVDYVSVAHNALGHATLPDGTLRIMNYPTTQLPSAATRAALIDGGDLTEVEAAFYAEQGYYFLHRLVSGPVTIPYVVRDANGAERPADVIRAWDWVQNVGLLDAERAGPFLVSEVEHQGGIASLTIGAAEAYAYNGPDRMPTKGRYVGAHRVRTRTTQRVSFAKYWAWKHRKDKKKPKMPRHHARYGTIRGWKWTDVEGKYV